MRPTTRLVAILACSLLCIPTIFAQTNPPASDPHEFVTHDPRVLTRASDRAAAIDLLLRARQKINLRELTVPYELNVSFDTNGSTMFEGTGTMQEMAAGASVRLTAQLQDWKATRILYDGRNYSSNTTDPVPLRVQMVRAAVLAPIPEKPEPNTIRQATVKRDGKTVSCVLGSGSVGPNPPPRAWTESEYCVDTATDLLQMWSEAPGVFAIYDYEGSTEFHGHTLPRQISIYQEGRLAVQIHVDSLEDVKNLDPALLAPTQEMLDAGEAVGLGLPNRFPLRVDPTNEPTSSYFQPVIVHAILDAQDGTVIDAEPIQNYDPQLTQAAMDLLSTAAFPPMGFQRDVFINVQFHLPAGAAATRVVIRPSVRWVILDREVRVVPRREPRHIRIK
jgi:hypothetical protein